MKLDIRCYIICITIFALIPVDSISMIMSSMKGVPKNEESQLEPDNLSEQEEAPVTLR